MEEKDKRYYLDQWFGKHENCTYQEFIDFYNNGNEIKRPLKFFPIPEEIKPYLNMPMLLMDFINKYNLARDVEKVILATFNNDYDLQRYVAEVADQHAFYSAHGFQGSHWDLIREEWDKVR
jgi:hypothetical protein